MKNKQLEILEAVKVALDASKYHIDDLNGALSDLDNLKVKGELSQDAQNTLEELHELYMSLPIWDTIEDLVERITDIQEEIKSHAYSK